MTSNLYPVHKLNCLISSLQKSLPLIFLLVLLGKGNVQAQCGTRITMLFENFNGTAPIPGAVLANIYGSGTWNNPNYIRSGPRHGWFNVRNGLSNVDVYNRTFFGFCRDSSVNISLWTRRSFGTTNVTFSAIDGNGAVLATRTMNLSSFFQQINFNFTATTTSIRFVIHCNSRGGNGVDIVIEDLSISQCCTIVLPSSFTTDLVCDERERDYVLWIKDSEAFAGRNRRYDYGLSGSEDGTNFSDLGMLQPIEQNGQGTRFSLPEAASHAGYQYFQVTKFVDGLATGHSEVLRAPACNGSSLISAVALEEQDLVIQLNQSGMLTLYSRNGTVEYQDQIAEARTLRIPRSQLSAGILFLSMQAGDKRETRKLMLPE